jgi:non-specific serine/threonine protein kinase
LAELGANPAVQLLVERATAVQPRFGLTERNAPALAQICRRLDGIPLALELAAARVLALTPEQIAARLDQCFRLLTGGSRAALPRQQTLRATLDWSYELLSEAERRLLNRLAVFAGGWSLEAAETVCSDEHTPPEHVMDLLAQLVSKSLVLADEAGDGTERYRMLETVRQYARERLVAAGEIESVHRRYAAYFLAVGDQIGADRLYPTGLLLPSAEQRDELVREQDNLRAALRWWIKSDDAERAVKQAGFLFWVWFTQGYVMEGCEWLREILAFRSALGSPAIRRRALPLLARLACHHGEHAAALEAYEELLAAQRSAADRHGAAHTLIEVANVHYLRGAYSLAWACFEASRAEAADDFDQQLEGIWCHYGGMLALSEGRYQLARTLATNAVTVYDSESAPLAGAYVRVILGTADREEGRYEEANQWFLQGLDVAVDFGDRTLVAHLLEGFSGLASALGQHQRAVRLGGAAAAMREADGTVGDPLAWHSERWLAISRLALGEEAALAAWATGRSLPMDQALDEAEHQFHRSDVESVDR